MELTYDNDQGAKAIKELQAMAGIEITLEEALNGRPDAGEPGWLGLSKNDRAMTEFAHKQFCVQE